MKTSKDGIRKEYLVESSDWRWAAWRGGSQLYARSFLRCQEPFTGYGNPHPLRPDGACTAHRTIATLICRLPSAN